jgi:hypothetical protein
MDLHILKIVSIDNLLSIGLNENVGKLKSFLFSLILIYFSLFLRQISKF